MARPVPSDADREATRHVRRLVAASEGDPLAPFALRPEKRYVFAPDNAAAVGFSVRLGIAVASGDPVGDPDSWDAAIGAFVLNAQANRWPVAVLGAGERARPMWEQYRLHGVPIGRDVVVRQDDFTLQGRRFRNLRQAIQRSHNAGVSVEFSLEGELTDAQVEELRAIMRPGQREDRRGYSMILGGLFNGGQPDALFAIARDCHDGIVAAHRYLRAGAADLTLDFPLRSPNAPNGVDERLIAETVAWGAENGIKRVSLAFAPFPELFAKGHDRGLLATIAYGAVHMLDPLISVERLYRYLRKFHAFDQQRFVMLRWRNIVRVAIALLMLEFF